MSLGILKTINPRTIWKNEEQDFTPWLADNIKYLSEAIGFTIEIDEIEKKVGSYELDIFGHIEGTAKKVVIENQLEISDHKHLGQLITYAAGLDAEVIIWVTLSINDEHKKAIEWLNEISNEETNFFLVRPEVIKIDDSKPAARFQVEASPSDFERIMKSMVNKNSPRHQMRRVFWTELIKYLSSKEHQWAKGRRTTSDSWLSFSAGSSQYRLTVSMANKSRIRVEIGFDSGDKETNKKNFDKLYKNYEYIGSKFEIDVSWERLDDKNMSRIAVYLPYDKSKINVDEEYNLILFDWIEVQLVVMMRTIGEYF